MNCVIYKIVDQDGRFYIGSTNNFEYRKYQHLWSLRKGIHHNIKLQNSFNKYGESYFDFFILEECTGEEQYVLEEKYVKQSFVDFDRKKIYNISQECVRPPSMKGKNHTKEAREKIGLAHRGLKHTEETRKKMSIAQTGKKLSAETRRKMSAARTGNNHSQCRAVNKICLKTGAVIKTYEYILLVEKDGYSSTAVNNVLSGRSKTSGGFKWEYVLENA